MGRESRECDSTVFRSSIALLQERFRQLQRVKEMREERLLLRLLSEHKHLNFIATHYEPERFAFNGPETHQFMLVSPLPPPQVSLSLGTTSTSNNENGVCGGTGAPPLMNLWPIEAPISDQVSSNELVVHNYGSDSDFDTSLRL